MTVNIIELVIAALGLVNLCFAAKYIQDKNYTLFWFSWIAGLCCILALCLS